MQSVLHELLLFLAQAPNFTSTCSGDHVLPKYLLLIQGQFSLICTDLRLFSKLTQEQGLDSGNGPSPGLSRDKQPVWRLKLWESPTSAVLCSPERFRDAQSNPKWEDMCSCICPRLLSEAFRFISSGSAVRRFVFPCWRLIFFTCVCSCCFGIDV